MIDIITSKSNEKAKFIRSLNDKKYREKYNCFYIEGIKVVKETIENRKAIDIMFIAYSEEMLIKLNGGKKCLDDVTSYCNANNIPLLNFSKEVFLSVTDTVTSQGILVVLKKISYDITSIIKSNIENKKNILMLDKIQDAGNMGTIIRSCDSFNIDLIICRLGTTDCYMPKVVRSTMGSILRVKVIYVNDEELNYIIEMLKKELYIIVGTTLDINSIDLEELDFKNNYLFIMGNEANGISDTSKKICDKYIKIEMSGRSESLNVAVATSIILYKQFKK